MTDAVAAARSIASSQGLRVEDARVLNNSNKLTVRLLPCDVVARVAPAAHHVAELEIDLARRLAQHGCPVAALEPRAEPRVYERGDFAVTLWTYYPTVTPYEVPPADYAEALRRLHLGMREVDVATPHFTDRVESAQQLLASHELTPALPQADRALLGDTLRALREAIGECGGEQLIHGEPHPENLLNTARGPVFIDFETCCRGPVEFDLAHAPTAAGDHYPGVEQALLEDGRILMLAMITTWRWDRDDQLPDGRERGAQWMAELRAAVARREQRSRRRPPGR